MFEHSRELCLKIDPLNWIILIPLDSKVYIYQVQWWVRVSFLHFYNPAVEQPKLNMAKWTPSTKLRMLFYFRNQSYQQWAVKCSMNRTMRIPSSIWLWSEFSVSVHTLPSSRILNWTELIQIFIWLIHVSEQIVLMLKQWWIRATPTSNNTPRKYTTQTSKHCSDVASRQFATGWTSQQQQMSKQ